MRVTTKGQVTIPQEIRDKFGMGPSSEVDFVEEEGRVYLVKTVDVAKRQGTRFRRYRGVTSVRMKTEDILALTRGSDERSPG